ncbi:uncharacterized protein ASPGLDRAFT_51403 [Aspergillus glaucus CBS 516.65]|uniref:Uncharacterized protein n=1 Tax=Aspergillus glaucus CBS 516.65 TaxID=1160497 RepID=A0A1L9V9G0_ASPGL|nr:hypothetical protein ASPGLDRAFT_51403 [Aspergillus glaucus CBS 516.65]OJJ80561.1 hypothetical protein ASPGLDRAFT_51403 [Aspergillus glaucus CBS 516.65]
MTDQEPIDRIVRFLNGINLPEGDRDASCGPEDDSDVSNDGELKDDSDTEQEVDQSPPISALISMGLPVRVQGQVQIYTRS